MELIREKITQAHGLLKKSGLDLWLVFARETTLNADPVMELVVGQDVVWPSFFAYTAAGEAIALVGSFDERLFTDAGCFTEVRSYTQGVREDIVALLNTLDPKRIAINFSLDDPSCDGLTHGMYLLLCDYLKGTPYLDRLVSAEDFCARLRSRKTPGELSCLTEAAAMAQQIWERAAVEVAPGLTEKEIAASIDWRVAEAGAANSFSTLVNAGDKSSAGHGAPTDAVLQPGDLLHVDFGVKSRGYCSDIQRLMYLRRKGEDGIPLELADAFATVANAITETAAKCRPGVRGYEVDALARSLLTDEGYPEYQHALGHQLGRHAHDGGGLLAPKWERYGRAPEVALEENQVFTLELEIILPGIGCVGLEEDIRVTPEGGRFLCQRQEELLIQ